MARKAGVITIDLQAGTSQFVLDLEKAKGQVRDFGGHMTSSMASSSAAVRLFEGDVTHNLRAVERFLSTTLGLGPVLRAAFPVVGAIAFAGVIAETGKKVYDFFKGMEEAPEKISGAFHDLNAPLELANTQLELSNARMENTLAKLNRKPENHVKVALLEAKEAAEQLNASLEKDLGSLDKLLREQAGSWWHQFATQALGQGSSSLAAALARQVGGETGFGGFRGSIADVSDPAKLLQAYAAEIAKVEAMMHPASGAVSAWKGEKADPLWQMAPAMDTATKEMFDAVLRNLKDEMQHIASTGQNINLHGKVGQAQDDADARKPLLEELNRLQEQLNRATEAGATAEQKISEEERNQLQDMAARNVLTSQTAALVEKIYDARRLDAYKARLQELSQVANEGIELSERMANEQSKEWEHTASEIEGLMAHLSDSFRKGVEAAEKMGDEVYAAEAKQQAELVGIHSRGHNPLGTLAVEQAIELQALARNLHDELARTADVEQRRLLIGQAQEKVMQMQTEYAKKQAEIQQKGVKDFFLEMEDQAQKAGNILYESMHQALDQVSDELSKLLTGQKTHFGKMLQQGASMVKKSIESSLHTGLGKLWELIHPKKKALKPFDLHDGGWHGPSGNANDPIYVSNVGGQELPEAPPLAKAPLPKAVDILKSLGLGGAVFGGGPGGGGGLAGAGGGTPSVNSTFTPWTDSDDFPAMAGGGNVDPGQTYWVGDGGEPELFTPRSAGTITPMSKLGGGDTHNWYIDARGSELGVENRIARTMEMVHSSAVRNSVVANAERAKRTPHRRS